MRARFPAGMLLGAATAATQVEGHCPTQDWLRFSREPGRVAEGDTPEIACDHWNRWPEDVKRMSALGLQSYRLSVEWARIEPAPGQIDHDALDRYRQLLGALRDANIVPYVTLHHFTLPTWVADEGGFLWAELPARLTEFARTVVGALGDLCERWITINEPNVACAQGYLNGEWPPARSGDVVGFIRSQRNLLEAHTGMYRALHDLQTSANVGVAHHLRVIEPEHPHRRRDRLATRAMETAFNEAFVGALVDGAMTALDPFVRRLGGFDTREAQGTQDFFGLNYYGRDLVSLKWSARQSGFVSRAVPEGAVVSDLGWEVYPEGLTQLINKWHRATHLPIVITENGLADAADRLRGRFLVQHLDALCQAAEQGAQLEGYLHWSLLDNFEWSDGYAPRFGLYEVDYATQERRLRPSGELYKALIAEGGIPSGVWERFGAAG